MNTKHIKSLITITLLVLNLLAVLVSVISHSWLLLVINAVAACVMGYMLYCDWQECEKARKKQFLAG
jgi:hypothetical protein